MYTVEKGKSLIKDIEKVFDRMIAGSLSSILSDDLKHLKDGIIKEIKSMVNIPDTVTIAKDAEHMKNGRTAKRSTHTKGLKIYENRYFSSSQISGNFGGYVLYLDDIEATDWELL